MATAPAPVMVPLETYLDTVYRPDCDWIDGEVKERNLGERPHAAIQLLLGHLFLLNGSIWQVEPLTEQRVQTSADHYRIADLCVVRRDAPVELIVRTPPVLCVEILSRDDRMSEIQERVEDYLAMGVQAVWVIDLRRRRAYLNQLRDAVLSTDQMAESLIVPNTPIAIPLAEIFAKLDDLEARS